jgi:hypothetical protein
MSASSLALVLMHPRFPFKLFMLIKAPREQSCEERKRAGLNYDRRTYPTRPSHLSQPSRRPPFTLHQWFSSDSFDLEVHPPSQGDDREM